MKHKLPPLVLLTATATAALLWMGPGVAQEFAGFPEDGRLPPYRPPSQYLPGGQPMIPGPPIPPVQSSRPASWPGTPAAARQWNTHSSSRSGQNWAAEYPRSLRGGYPGPAEAQTYPRTAAGGYQPPGDQPGRSPGFRTTPYDPSGPAIYRPLPYDSADPPDYGLQPHRPSRPPAYRPEEPYIGRTVPSPNGYPVRDPQIPNAAEAPYGEIPNAARVQYPYPPYAAEVPISGPAPQGEPPPAAQMELVEGAIILARVGPEVILGSEVLPAVNDIIARNKDRIPPHRLQQQRRLLIEQQLQVPIESKLIYLDAREKIPEENLPRIEESLGEQFEKEELQKLMERSKVQTRWELEEKLRSMGTSLQRRKTAFVQRALAQTWLHQQLNLDEETTYDQMWEYYRVHAAEFERPARARWEELTVSFSKYRSKAESHAAIARMGNQVLAGVSLEEVAGRLSDGSTAAQGGLRDWTRKGSLVSAVLDEALFGLQVGRLSPILETEDGFHIIRVTRRELAHRISFAEAQAEIRQKVRQQRTETQLRKYVADLRKQIPVWTIFDDQTRDEQLSERDGDSWR